jgi:hypothetical protein
LTNSIPAGITVAKELRLCFGVQWHLSFASRLNDQLAILQCNRQIEPFPKLEHSDVLSQNLGIDPDGDTDSRTIIRPPIFVGYAVYDFVAQLTAGVDVGHDNRAITALLVCQENIPETFVRSAV